MAFFDKLTNMAKTAADKTGDMFEIGKINGKINSEKSKIAVVKAELGEYFWKKFENGEQFDSQAAALCEQIKSSLIQIETYNAQIDQIKAENEAQAAAAPAPVQAEVPADQQAHQAPVNENEPIMQQPQPSGSAADEAAAYKFCSNCGAKLNSNAKFCISCGTPLN